MDEITFQPGDTVTVVGENGVQYDFDVPRLGSNQYEIFADLLAKGTLSIVENKGVTDSIVNPVEEVTTPNLGQGKKGKK